MTKEERLTGYEEYYRIHKPDCPYLQQKDDLSWLIESLKASWERERVLKEALKHYAGHEKMMIYGEPCHKASDALATVEEMGK